MKIDSCAFLPKARSEGIITRELDGELLVYDRTRDRAHCLNKTAAAIWKLCDGATNAPEIAERLSGAGADGRRQQAERSGQCAVGSEQ